MSSCKENDITHLNLKLSANHAKSGSGLVYHKLGPRQPVAIPRHTQQLPSWKNKCSSSIHVHAACTVVLCYQLFPSCCSALSSLQRILPSESHSPFSEVWWPNHFKGGWERRRRAMMAKLPLGNCWPDFSPLSVTIFFEPYIPWDIPFYPFPISQLCCQDTFFKIS